MGLAQIMLCNQQGFLYQLKKISLLVNCNENPQRHQTSNRVFQLWHALSDSHNACGYFMFANILTVPLCNGFREALKPVINMLHSIALLQDLLSCPISYVIGLNEKKKVYCTCITSQQVKFNCGTQSLTKNMCVHTQRNVHWS